MQNDYSFTLKGLSLQSIWQMIFSVRIMCPGHNSGRKLSPGVFRLIVLEINAMVRSRARDFNVNKAVWAPARLCAPGLRAFC